MLCFLPLHLIAVKANCNRSIGRRHGGFGNAGKNIRASVEVHIRSFCRDEPFSNGKHIHIPDERRNIGCACPERCPNPVLIRAGTKLSESVQSDNNDHYDVPSLSILTLKVFDMLGREVATLADGVKSSGQYTVTFDGNGCRAVFISIGSRPVLLRDNSFLARQKNSFS